MNFWKLLVISLLCALLFACAERKPIVVEEFKAESLQEFIEEMQKYSYIEGILNLQYETKNSQLNGEASLRISKKELLLRVYYLGFPAGEIYEEDGSVSSNLIIEKDRLNELAKGIRKGFIWWQGDFSIEENSDDYILKDRQNDRVLILKKVGFMPVSQILNVDGQKIIITYHEYGKIQTEDGKSINIPLNMEVNYKNRTLKIKIERLRIKNV